MLINKIKCLCFAGLFGMMSATAIFSMNTDSNSGISQNHKKMAVDIEETKETQTITPNLKLKYDPVVIDQYIDNPNTTIITGFTEDDTNEFSLNRSFKDALKVNIDKESVERANGL